MVWKKDNMFKWTYSDPKEQPDYKKYSFEFKINNTSEQTENTIPTHSNHRMKISYLLNPGN